MKRLIIALLCTLSAVPQTKAQYNRVFYNALNPVGNQTGESGYDIVNAGNGHVGVLATQWGMHSLKELDFSGNVVCSEIFYFNIGATLIERLCKAPNGDYLVAGRQHVGVATQPIIGRFRKDPGNPTKFICVWMYRYPADNVYTWAFGRGESSRINIVRAEDDVSESYIIATEGDDSNTPMAGTGTQTVRAFKIDANGTLVWNKKYYDNSGTVQSIHVKALTYGHIQEGHVAHKYLIGGCTDIQNKTFYMFIDGNGNMVSSFIEYDMPGRETFHEAIYDASTAEFILTNDFNTSSGSTSPAQIAVSKINYATHAITQTDYYWENDPINSSSSPRGIVEDATGTYYVIGGQSGKEDAGTGTLYSGPCILKIDKMANVQFFKGYNRLGTSNLNDIVSIVDIGGTENYAAAGAAFSSPLGDNTRVFTTDIAGITCGEEDLVYDHGTLNLSPTIYNFSEISLTGRVTLTPTTGGTYQVRNCDPANPQYKPGTTSVGKPNRENLAIYPTILAQNESVVNLDLPVSKACNVSVIVYSQDGREIQKQSYNITPGSASIKFDTEINTPGIYVMRIDSDNSELRNRLKITKL